MPTIPTYQGPQERRAPLPAPMQNADALSAPQRAKANLGQALAGVGGTILGIAEHKAERDAQTAANTADSEITAGWLEWDSQARKQYRGANVGEYEAKAKEWWDKAGETYGKALTPRAKEKIAQALGRKRNAAMGSVLSYAGAEQERHADDTAAANVATTIQFGVTSGDVAGASNQVRRIAAEVGARKGWSTEQVQAEIGKNLSNLHLAQIAKLAEADPTAADAYYKANREEVAFGMQSKVEGILKGELDSQFANQQAAKMADLPLEEQLTEAAKINDPQRRDKVITRIKEVVGLRNIAKQEREKQFSDQAWQLVGQNKRVPEAVLGNMDGSERVQLQEFLRKRAEHMAKGGTAATVKTNPKALARIYDMMRDDPEGFKKLRMESLMLDVSGSDMEQISRIQRDMLKPNSTEAKEVVTTLQQLSVYTDGMAKEKRPALEAAAFDALNAHKRAKGKDATYEERKAIFDRLVMDGEVRSGSWYMNDPNKKYYEATPAERARFVPIISKDERSLIINALKAEGIAKPTDEQITARFKLAKGMQ